jgi:hypothetical protein
LDILGKTRTLPPDLGAYQSEPFPKQWYHITFKIRFIFLILNIFCPQ